MATKQERGTKRTCQGCGSRFYDLNRSPITCPMCSAAYVIASSPAALAALQAEERAAAKRSIRKPVFVDDSDGPAAPAAEGEEALSDVETEDAGETAQDETFLEEEEEEGGDVSNIVGGTTEGDEEP